MSALHTHVKAQAYLVKASSFGGDDERALKASNLQSLSRAGEVCGCAKDLPVNAVNAVINSLPRFCRRSHDGGENVSKCVCVIYYILAEFMLNQQ